VDLDDDDLGEVVLYRQFKKASAPSQEKTVKICPANRLG
jgi:hypothetical protein